MSTNKQPQTCPILSLLTVLCKRHALVILYTLTKTQHSFSELQTQTHINTATLTRRLRDLEQAELIEQRICTKDSRFHYYQLTPRGKRISTLMEKF